MWQKACELVKPSIAAIVRKSTNNEGRETWRTVGTAFQISDYPQPTFMTCAHVLVDGHGRENFDHAIFAAFGNADGSARGINITHVSLQLDAIIFVSDAGAIRKNVSFSSDSILEMGTPIAAIGFPNPKKPQLKETSGGSLNIKMRFSSGYISSNSVSIKLPQTPYTRHDLKHYEMNVDLPVIAQEIRTLYPVAWADFYRFLLGWNPDSWKICNYMEEKAKQGLLSVINN